MILLIECGIDSDTILTEIIEQKSYPYHVKMYPDERKRLSWISIERIVVDYEANIPRADIQEGQLSGFTFPGTTFLNEQRDILQYIESFAALDLGVRKIFYENPTIRWIPQTDEEQLEVPILAYSANQDYPANNREVRQGWLQGTILHRNRLIHLKEPFRFYRLGANFYAEQEYGLSFLHFFLMIEGLFSEGNSEKKFLIPALMNAEDLNYGIEQTFINLEKPVSVKHLDWFQNQQHQNIEVNNDRKLKLVNILYDHRGLLSHYAMKSSRKRHDFEQAKYHSLAFITMSICKFCSIKLRMNPFRAEDQQ
ncbi:hypothetical protein [Mucilaginibacter sp. SG564]|uniref:hypothetical protein n=1 Tax=Mucilaginibacter sp. SG564 TaxID=2587022 RepID=UPI001554A727|nr:hypothetical protein [Mucilaginibacter sp. SG564]NOW95006.1 hypothetical protein [Mucilaginibacter sp. SG564]